jgi:hypothetical protein
MAYMVLVDSSTGIVEGLRVVELDAEITDSLRDAVARQLTRPSDDVAASEETMPFISGTPAPRASFPKPRACRWFPRPRSDDTTRSSFPPPGRT